VEKQTTEENRWAKEDRVLNQLDAVFVTFLSIATIAIATEHWLAVVASVLVAAGAYAYKQYIGQVIVKFKEQVREEEKKQAAAQAEMARAAQLKQMQEAVKKLKRSR
jgi:uncharacterized membrane protein (DUF106 family)